MVGLPEPIPQRVVKGPPPEIEQLVMLLFVAPLPVETTFCSQTTALVVLVPVLVRVRLRVAVEGGQIVLTPAPFDPLILTQSAPFNTIKPVAETPEMVALTSVAGLIVSVFTEFAAAFALIVIGNVSAV